MVNWDKDKNPIEVAKDIVDIMEVLDYDDKIEFMRNMIEEMIYEASSYEIKKI